MKRVADVSGMLVAKKKLRMPFYQYLTNALPDGERIIERLLALRAQLRAEIPVRTQNATLLLATWNIREFESPKYGERVPESYYYIAEIISHFDLVAVQEVYRDLEGLYQVQRILGNDWKFLFTDETMGSAGNKERLAFLYDSRKVTFAGLASEIVLPPSASKTGDGEKEAPPARQLARTPFSVGFKSGWTNFVLTTVHIYYGDDRADDPTRVQEIQSIAAFLAKQSEDSSAWSHNSILLGDFNIYTPNDPTMAALLKNGFSIPAELQNLPSNASQDKTYDQIAFRIRKDRFETTGKAGVFNFYKTVFREEDEQVFAPYMGEAYTSKKTDVPRTEKEKTAYYRQWRTFQMSDHFPMWVELRIDFSDAYLQRKLDEKTTQTRGLGAGKPPRHPLLP